MELLDFGKYNFYIWASYGITFLVLALNVALPYVEKKNFLKKIKRRNYLNDSESNAINEEKL